MCKDFRNNFVAAQDNPPRTAVEAWRWGRRITVQRAAAAVNVTFALSINV
jgi:hypothetical protein